MKAACSGLAVDWIGMVQGNVDYFQGSYDRTRETGQSKKGGKKQNHITILRNYPRWDDRIKEWRELGHTNSQMYYLQIKEILLVGEVEEEDSNPHLYP